VATAGSFCLGFTILRSDRTREERADQLPEDCGDDRRAFDTPRHIGWSRGELSGLGPLPRRAVAELTWIAARARNLRSCATAHRP
jgi:hypothetical protein